MRIHKEKVSLPDNRTVDAVVIGKFVCFEGHIYEADYGKEQTTAVLDLNLGINMYEFIDAWMSNDTKFAESVISMVSSFEESKGDAELSAFESKVGNAELTAD